MHQQPREAPFGRMTASKSLQFLLVNGRTISFSLFTATSVASLREYPDKPIIRVTRAGRWAQTRLAVTRALLRREVLEEDVAEDVEIGVAAPFQG
jgi:hypothetical protein